MSKIDISIIITVHNLENHIQPLLSTLYNQDISGINVEYIFVLDSCTDQSKEIINKWHHNAAFKILECDFQTPGLSRNYGFENSTGDYIWFVDGDDWILTDQAIKTLFNTISQNQLDILRFNFMSVWKEYHNAPGQGWMMVWQYVYKRELIENIHFSDKRNDEDVEFSRAVYAKIGGPIPTIKDTFYFYNWRRRGSLTYHIRD